MSEKYSCDGCRRLRSKVKANDVFLSCSKLKIGVDKDESCIHWRKCFKLQKLLLNYKLKKAESYDVRKGF